VLWLSKPQTILLIRDPLNGSGKGMVVLPKTGRNSGDHVPGNGRSIFCLESCRASSARKLSLPDFVSCSILRSQASLKSISESPSRNWFFSCSLSFRTAARISVTLIGLFSARNSGCQSGVGIVDMTRFVWTRAMVFVGRCES
jgi:hypothetical protein